METGETEVEEVEAAEEESEGAEPTGEAPEGASEAEDPGSKLEARLAQITGGQTGNGSTESGSDAAAREVSATTVGRMLGLATGSELRLMEGKIDLLSTRVNNMTVRMEKVISTLSQAPTGSDLERIDMQIGSLRVLIREAFNLKDSGEVPPRETPGPGERGDKPITGAKIVTNTDD